MAVTLTPPTTAPLASRTVPAILEVPVCAHKAPARAESRTTDDSPSLTFFMEVPPILGAVFWFADLAAYMQENNSVNKGLTQTGQIPFNDP
jgi:hypothetical protein